MMGMLRALSRSPWGDHDRERSRDHWTCVFVPWFLTGPEDGESLHPSSCHRFQQSLVAIGFINHQKWPSFPVLVPLACPYSTAYVTRCLTHKCTNTCAFLKDDSCALMGVVRDECENDTKHLITFLKVIV